MQTRLVALAKALLENPTAPYREQAVGAFIADFCRTRHLDVIQDEVGNVIVTYGRRYKNTVFAFEAHMDHPGFIAETDSVRNRLTALFYGTVENAYFKDAQVRFFTAAGPVRATVTKTEFDPTLRRRTCRLQTQGLVRRGDLGMWDLPACRIRGARLYSRACDDLIGCVAVLSLLEELHRRRIHKKVVAVFTVAEEAGFHGAKHLCMHKSISKNANIIAIETSAALPSAKMGDGVVIRVGDRSSIFTPALTAFLTDTAQRLQARDKTFRFQRKLMDGGTCESTIYSSFGCSNAAVCIPLGNYHNRDSRRGNIAAESIALTDLENMVKLFLAVVQNSENAKEHVQKTPPRYIKTTGNLDEFFYR